MLMCIILFVAVPVAVGWRLKLSPGPRSPTLALAESLEGASCGPRPQIFLLIPLFLTLLIKRLIELEVLMFYPSPSSSCSSSWCWLIDWFIDWLIDWLLFVVVLTFYGKHVCAKPIWLSISSGPSLSFPPGPGLLLALQQNISNSNEDHGRHIKDTNQSLVSVDLWLINIGQNFHSSDEIAQEPFDLGEEVD